MVASPGDLYTLTERDVIQMHRRDGLSDFGDMDDDYTLPSLGTGPRERRWPDFVAGDARGMARAPLRAWARPTSRPARARTASTPSRPITPC